MDKSDDVRAYQIDPFIRTKTMLAEFFSKHNECSPPKPFRDVEYVPSSGDCTDSKKQTLQICLSSSCINGNHDQRLEKKRSPHRTETRYGCRRSPHFTKTICASFHQQSTKQGLSKYRGFQCTSMAITAVMVSQTLPVDTWRTLDLDAILRFGDRFHVQLLSSIDRRSSDPRIALHEIPSGICSQWRVPVPSEAAKWSDEDYDITQIITLSKSDEYYGKVHATENACAMEDDLGDTPMEVSLDALFRHGYDAVIITVGSVSGAIIRDSHGRVRYFDPHSNNKSGQMNFRGTAVLLQFDSVKEFVGYIRKRDTSGRRRYEMIGLEAITRSIYKPIERL